MGNEKIALIVAAAPEVETAYIQAFYEAEKPYIIAADGGFDTLRALGITPDSAIGDFDSLRGNTIEGALVLPCEKDETDTRAAVRQALSMGFTTIYLAGVSGGRGDHYLANLSLLEFLYEEGAQGVLLDQNNRIVYQNGGKKTYPALPDYAYVGIVPLDSAMTISLTGLKYPLTDHPLRRSDMLTVCNEYKGDCFTVAVTGCVLIIYTRDGRKNRG